MVFLGSWWIHRCYQYCSVVSSESTLSLKWRKNWPVWIVGEKQLQMAIFPKKSTNASSIQPEVESADMCYKYVWRRKDKWYKAWQNVSLNTMVVHFIIKQQVLCRKIFESPLCYSTISMNNVFHSLWWTKPLSVSWIFVRNRCWIFWLGLLTAVH